MVRRRKFLLVPVTCVVIWLYVLVNIIKVSNIQAKQKQEYLRRAGTVHVIPTIYLVTPTHTRLEQKADLTRLSYTLRLVPNLHWILVEDGNKKSSLVSNFLNNSKLAYTHLNASTPKTQLPNKGGHRTSVSRGVVQRNAGISWIRENVRTPGVVYFADDDNTYDIRIFEEMRYTKKVSVWPVALVAHMKYEAPICKNGKVIGWETTYLPDREFAVDMAGFAVNAQLIHDNPEAKFRDIMSYLEPDFLKQLNLTRENLEPRANNCTQVFVWHTRTEKSAMDNEQYFDSFYKGKFSRSREV